MKINISYIDDEATLKRWNFDEPAIEFYDDYQHIAVPISKVNGHQIKVMLDGWRTLESILIENLRSIFTSEEATKRTERK